MTAVTARSDDQEAGTIACRKQGWNRGVEKGHGGKWDIGLPLCRLRNCGLDDRAAGCLVAG